MKVLLVNQAFCSGGITSYALELCKCLSRDHEMTVVLKDDRYSPIQNARVKVLYYDAELLTLKNALLFIKLINEELQPDVVISSKGTIVPVIVPFLKDTIKVITVSHSGRFFNSDYCAVNHQYTDTIIAASSEYNKRYLEKKFHIQDITKIKVIYNFLNNDPDLEKYHSLKKQNNPITIFYSGGSYGGKNPDLVLKIVRRLLQTDLNFKFYWTGSTLLPLTTTFFKHVKPNNVKQFVPKDERLVFLGRVASKKEYDNILANANILITPSRNEGCSMLLLEAHRSGAICLVADYLHSNREIVEKGKSGFVLDRHKPQDFVNVITDIINDHEKYYPIYDNSYDTYQKELSYPVWKQSIEEVIDKPSNHKSRRRTISKIKLQLDVLKMKRLYFFSLMGRFFLMSLPSFLSFRKQYHEIKKERK